MFLKKAIKKFIPNKTKKNLRNFWLLAEQYGQRKSISADKSIDKNGDEIPWYTYPAYEYLNSLDFQKMDVLEFGSGASSTWWAQRSKTVTSVEDNLAWYNKIKHRQSENLRIIFAKSKEEYILANSQDKYDIVVIDGKYRHDCAVRLTHLLKEDGLVIFDNADRHPTTTKLLRDSLNLIQVDMHGFGPINNYTWTTSLFFTRSFQCLPKTDRLPEYSIGSLRELSE